MWAVIKGLKSSLPPDLYLVGLIMCWKIWEGRNLEVHGDTRAFPSDLVEWSTAFLEVYSSAQVNAQISSSPENSTDWRPLEEGTIKINVDVVLPANTVYFRTSMVATKLTRRMRVVATSGSKWKAISDGWRGGGGSPWCPRSKSPWMGRSRFVF